MTSRRRRDRCMLTNEVGLHARPVGEADQARQDVSRATIELGLRTRTARGSMPRASSRSWRVKAAQGRRSCISAPAATTRDAAVAALVDAGRARLRRGVPCRWPNVALARARRRRRASRVGPLVRPGRGSGQCERARRGDPPPRRAAALRGDRRRAIASSRPCRRAAEAEDARRSSSFQVAMLEDDALTEPAFAAIADGAPARRGLARGAGRRDRGLRGVPRTSISAPAPPISPTCATGCCDASGGPAA